ncbi:MAG: DUF4412 domain-containing protein [Bacteroidia bacterium]|nr:DUF4412 domain-containing protein [Bacteroidia bacterium]
MMKSNSIHIFWLFWALLVMPFAVFSQSFSGTFFSEYEDVPKKEKGTIRWTISGEQLGMETEIQLDGKSYHFRGVLNSKSNTLAIETKSEEGTFYHQFSAKDIQEDPTSKNVVLNATNERKLILGISCRKYLSITEYHATELWLAETIDFRFSQFGELVKSPYGIPGLISKSIKGFPFEMTAKNNEGKVIYTFRVTEFQLGKIDKKQLLIPSN